MKIILPRQSLEIVSFPISTAPVDPATLTHQVAVVPPDTQPVGGDWFNAPFVDPNVEVLIRASTTAAAGGLVTLAVGRWRMWWRASSNPEFPVRQVGIVTVV
jgi:hypothetical protein